MLRLSFVHLICSRIAYLQRSGHVVLSDRDVSTRPCFVQPIEPFYEDYMFAHMEVEPRNDGSRLTPTAAAAPRSFVSHALPRCALCVD